MKTMKKLNALLCGVLVISAHSFVACGNDDDIDDLNSRVDLVEGMIKDLKSQLEASIASGKTIASATQDANGVWTLTLNNGETIVIKAGGGSVSIVENENNFVITVDGTAYTLPKGGAGAALIYRPEFEDGLVKIEDTDPVEVSFLVNGAAIKSLDGASIEVLEAYELRTRAADGMFKVADGATISGDKLTVPIQALGVEAGKSYAANVRVSVNGVDYVSNYFTIKMGDGFSFVSEDLKDYSFDASVTDAVKGEDNVWTATLPVALEDGVNFASLIQVGEGGTLPAGVEIRIGKQIADVSEQALNALKSGLNTKTGEFKFTERPGQAFPNGFVVYVVENEVTRMKVNWKYADPLADVNWVGVFDGNTGGHIEIRGAQDDGSDIFPAGANDIDLAADFTKAYENGGYSLMHDEGRFLNAYVKYSATYKEEGDLIYYDGTRLVMGNAGAKFAVGSKGLWWTSHQISLGSSNRRNQPDRPADEGSDDNIAWCGGNCNGELIYDGLNGTDRVKFGVNLEDNGHLITTANYKGWNMRVGVWVKYEYLYGEKELGGGALVWAWLNRRSCPAGVNDAEIVKTEE